MILAQGLLTAPSGFVNNKYYNDGLSDCKGYLPVFNNEIPESDLKKATGEADYLTPCLVELDLSGLQGEVTAIKAGNREVIQLDNIASEVNIDLLYLPLPLPVGMISKIIFEDKNKATDFKKDVETRSNIILNQLKPQSTAADSKLFKLAPGQPTIRALNSDPENLDIPQAYDLNHSKTYAYGGMLLLLFNYAKNGILSHTCFDNLADQKRPDVHDGKTQEILTFIHEYFHGGLDESLPANQLLKGIASSCLTSGDFKNSMIDSLRNKTWEQDQEIYDKRSKQLADALTEYVSNRPGAQSVSERFSNAKSYIEKILLMLFTREDSDSLVQFANDKIVFTEYDYVLFGLFFGMRDGYSKSPAFLKRYNSLQNYVSYKMAVYAHEEMKTGIILKEVKVPLTVWQYVDKKLSKTVVNTLSLKPCVQTVMPKADFQSESGKIIYQGYLEPTYKVILEKYFSEIGKQTISELTYNKLK